MKQLSTRLSSLKKGEQCIIESFTDEEMKQKLLEMGCLPGETITVDRFAPFGCPMAIHIAGSTLSLRLEEAESVIVRKIN
jgi:ferrous iron transport protein A